jgi:Mn2+/Fe2+ NRAMP family transporter
MTVIGPGLLVMLADTDAGSLITAASSGAQWGYKFIVLQVALVPALFIVQELCVRLGLVTGKGHGELIKEHFGAGWAWLSASTLLITCIGAIVTQLSGLAGIASLFGVPPSLILMGTIGMILSMVWTGSYARVERIAMAFGLFELAFIAVAWRAGPHQMQGLHELVSLPLNDRGFLYLAAANIGAVIMPWMVFYQQSAIIDKGLGIADLKRERIDTAIGAVVTQAIMIAMIVTTASTLHSAKHTADLASVPQIAHAITPYLGDVLGKIVFAAGMGGAALVATVVVCLAAAWGIGEVAGFKRSLEHDPGEAPWFYTVFSLCLIGSGLVVSSAVNLVALSIAIEVMNALLLPIVLGFLLILATRVLSPPYRLTGVHAWISCTAIASIIGLGTLSGVIGIWWRS